LSAVYVVNTGASQFLLHPAFASSTSILPSGFTDCTIPVCPTSLLRGFETNIPPATGVLLTQIDSRAFIFSSSVFVNLELPVGFSPVACKI